MPGPSSYVRAVIVMHYLVESQSACPNGEVIAVGIADREVLRTVEQALTAGRLAAIVNRAAELYAAQKDQTATFAAEQQTLDKEIRNLTSAIAAGGELASLVGLLTDKEHRRQAVERELQARSTPFDLARLRKSLAAHAADWRGMLKRQTDGAKQILQKLVAQRFVFTPDHEKGGYFFKADGDLGLLLQMASPAGPAEGWQLPLKGFSDLKHVE